MSTPHALIVGAGIAGPTAAYWLNRYGWRTTVVERDTELRTAGQNIDVRGAGREVIRRMGLEDAIRAATTGEQGTRFVDDDGRTVAEFAAGTHDSDGATAEVEILRGDLARLLVESTDAACVGTHGTAYVWGDHVTALEHHDDGVDVTFAHGPRSRYDAVIGADGIGSSTRTLAFGPVDLHSLHLRTYWSTIPRTPGDDDWWRWYIAPGGRSLTLRPDPVGTIRASLSMLTDGVDRAPTDDDELRAQLRRHFTDVGWEAPRVLSALDGGGELYAQDVAQVRLPSWSTGRVALVGDAGYCPSPVSGMGTSVAIVGAYVLAGELAAHVDPRDALRSYERVLRPYVEQAQDLPPGTPRVAHPRTRAGVLAIRTVLRLGATPAGRAAAARLFTPPAERIDLPDYAHLEARAARADGGSDGAGSGFTATRGE